MSIAELIAVLYFDAMRLRPEEPDWPERDRFVLSKGHACPILYAALARKGYFPLEELKGLRSYGSILQGHPVFPTTPGIESVAGSLGNGISIGLGMALGCRMQNLDSRVFVIIGDGEQQEGIIWEAAMAAAQHKAGKLIVFADLNNYQSGGKTSEISSLYPVEDKWKAFHWHVQSIDGHDIEAIKTAIGNTEATDAPSLIACKTTKGKGISYMENNNAWHKRIPTIEEVEIARKELEG